MQSAPPGPPPIHAPAGAPRIVGLGASAGGLDALQAFLAAVPRRSGLAYIVVQHMDPTHKAMLGELLQRATALPVHEAAEATRVAPDTVYVIAPNSELSLAGGVLHLADPAQPRGMRLPIDVLFASLAREQGERAIGVVLSGMGSDGTLGLQAIKTQGGLTLAQQPETAQFDSMPRSAIAEGCVDIVAAPAELPAHILRVVAQQPGPGPGAPEGEAPSALAAILAQLREHVRHDLSAYKSSTLLRRIERRMAVHGLATMADYEGFLHGNPQELELLFKELLIGVTSFFRDAVAWQELAEQVLPPLIARHVADGTGARAWVVGCSTGEEAYTLAMLFKEACAGLPAAGAPGLQVFATDLSADAIAAARRGVYPEKIAADLTPERLANFFVAAHGGYQVAPSIREMVLFAQHDVILDPPFTRLDILCCRNLMIYFQAGLQRRLMPLFHYSLCPGGALLLGGSETIGRAQSLFTPLQPKSRIYWRRENPSGSVAVDFPVHRRASPHPSLQESKVTSPPQPLPNLQALADQVLLQTWSPPAVLVNESGDILYISGRTGRYLEPAAGKANWNIHVMARPAIRTQLAVALRRTLQDRQPVELHGLSLGEGEAGTLDLSVAALQEPRALQGMVMIVFRDVPAPAPGGQRRGRHAAAPDPALAEELMRTREEIRALRQEMAASQEELQAANEELQSTNEELQSANEELTTSKEEAQSMNEELQTINGELQSKLDDLALAQSDMNNLLNSTDIATLFLDNELNVRRFTDRITRIIHLREGDIGRPLSDLASTLVYPELHADAKETLRTLAATEKQVPTTDGHWYSVRVMPYRTLANVIQGAVITFVDITAAKELEARLRKA